MVSQQVLDGKSNVVALKNNKLFLNVIIDQ